MIGGTLVIRGAWRRSPARVRIRSCCQCAQLLTRRRTIIDKVEPRPSHSVCVNPARWRSGSRLPTRAPIPRPFRPQAARAPGLAPHLAAPECRQAFSPRSCDEPMRAPDRTNPRRAALCALVALTYRERPSAYSPSPAPAEIRIHPYARGVAAPRIRRMAAADAADSVEIEHHGQA